jgi:NAD(P)-dependent dehydrogenase (short-subunit alcohol dehydrogenase family)
MRRNVILTPVLDFIFRAGKSINLTGPATIIRACENLRSDAPGTPRSHRRRSSFAHALFSKAIKSRKECRLTVPDSDGSSRIVLVTGASRGIGRAAAIEFARQGAHVVALARTQGALEELDDEIRALRPGDEAPTTLVPMDLRDSLAIDRLGEALFRRWGRLDAFVGNAGVLGVLSPLHHVDPKEWDSVLAVNVTANWRLIRSLDPLLRKSAAGRVAFVTSSVASRADFRAYWGPYATSKAALDAIARTYAAETLNTSNVRVMLVNPGPLRTMMRAKAMPGEDPMTLRTPEDIAPKIVELCSSEWAETGKLYDFPTDKVMAFRGPE